jgi:cytochrome c oxidase subunit 3
MAKHIHIDESPIRFERWLRRFPNWLARFFPSSGGRAHDEHGKGMFGFTIFLLSESIIFLSFIFTYVALRLTADNWLPPKVAGPELTSLVKISTVVLLSSSAVIQFAERALARRHLNKFRWLWLTTSAMGTYFLINQAIEWSHLDFGLSTGLVGGTFYVLTGFHGLHVLAGVLLQLLMLVRSFLRGNYNKGYLGVSMVTLFWHFVDGIWVILFSLLYLWQA